MVLILIFLLTMAQLSSDTIYRDLKQKGLELTTCVRLKVPDPEPIKVGLINKLSSVIRRPQPAAPAPLKLVQIMYSAFLAIRNQAIFIYKYTYNEANKKIDVQHEGTLNLAYQIDQVFPCDSKHIQDKDLPIIVKYKDGCSYLNFDLKESTIEERCFLKIKNLLHVGWINDRECLLADDKNVHHYIVAQGQLKLKVCKPLNLIINEGEALKKIWVLPHVDEQQDSIIPIFYTTIPNRQTEFIYPPMKLKVKEILRTLDGDLTDPQSPDYILETQNLEYRDQFHIVSVGDYYCLQLALEVLIMKKKYDKYMLLDNMMEILSEYRVKLNRKGIIVSIGQKLLELNCIHFADPKCNSRICDVIEFPQELKGYDKYFKEVWPIINYKEYTLIFVFMNENEITLSGLVKLQPMQKMMALAKRDPKQNLEIIQDMALNLGISRKDFYLKLWTTSKKQNADIYKFLIPCNDVGSIKKQLKSTLRTRTIQVSEMLKILQKITDINLMNLRNNLNQKNLKEYVKNDFLRKKVKLNEVNKLLDHRIFEKIYSSSILNIFEDIVQEQLDPIQPVYDPLHLNLNYQPIKQLKSLENVFQQFKVVILEQYKTFLIAFLSKFPKKILKVLQTFSFLLPNHPFEIEVQKPSKTNEPILIDPKTNDTVQELWFQTVKVCEWQEQITRQRILKELFHDFQTSKIIQTVDEFYHSLYGKENRRWKHGLITANLDEYRAKLKMLSGIQLYLDVCQFANQLSVAEDGDPKISEKILAILATKNKLCEPDLHFCKLYANMHYFMLKNKIIPKSKLEISNLISLKPENLVAVFFLENKQRKEHIFTDFKNLYEDKNQFKEILQKFVQSQNCSRIQLEILMKEIKKEGQKFQEQNQDIIEILISGICQKVQIRQTLLLLDVDEDGDEENTTEIDDIQLNKILALKINRVKRLKLCKDIFKSFGLEKMTYKQLLDLENQNQIFKLLLAKYNEIIMSKAEDEEFVVSIEDQQEISLQNPKNLLTVLIYLQENIYYSAKTFDILIILGLDLIQSRYFKAVTSIINDNNALETLNIDRNEFVQMLTVKALDNIYLEPDIMYDETTKDQIINILDIDEEDSPFKVREKAKLDLAAIFVGWKLDVHPSDIHSIASVWKDVTLRSDFMQDLITNYADHLDFVTLQEFYRLLQVIDNQTLDVNILNKQYIQFCDFFAKKLLQKKRFSQASEIIAFLMQIEGEKIDYPMMAQAYVQGIIEKYSQNQEVGRKLIELFSQTYGTSLEQNITQLLQNYFSSTELNLKVWQQDRNNLILISYKYCYDESQKVNCEIGLDKLWEIAKKQSTNPAELYYNYFFLTMALTNSTTGFQEIVGISYNLDKITNILLGDLMSLFDKDQNLWFVNYHLFLAQFTYSAVLSEAAHTLNINLERDNRQNKFDMLFKQLSNYKPMTGNIKILINILNKLRNQVGNKSRRNSRKDRYRRKLRQMLEMELQKNKNETQEKVEPVEVPEDRPSVFLTWKQVQDDKKHLSTVSQFIMSEKDLIDQVFESNLDTSKIKQPKKTQFKDVPGKRFLEGLFQPSKKDDKMIEKGGSILATHIRNRNYKEINKYNYSEVLLEIKKIFTEDDQTDYRQIIQILDELDIGDPEKRNLFRLARIYLDYLPNTIRRGLFPIEFFDKSLPEDLTEEKKLALIYSELQSNLSKLNSIISSLQIKEIANLIGSILNSVEYCGLVYYQQLLHVGQVGVFDSSSALMAQECINGLMSSYPEIICQRYEAILDTMIDKQTRIFVKEIMARVVGERQNYSDVAELIKKYDSSH